MTLSEFIEKLSLLEAEGNGDLPVALADWTDHGCEPPREDKAEKIGLYFATYIPKGEIDPVIDGVVCLG